MITTREAIRVVEPHCKVGTQAIKLLESLGITESLNYLKKYGVTKINLDYVTDIYERNKQER